MTEMDFPIRRVWCGECGGLYVAPACPCGALHEVGPGQIRLTVTRTTFDYSPATIRWEEA